VTAAPESALAASTLSVLCRAPAEQVKEWAESRLERLEPLGIHVERNATGLVLLPMQDTVRGGPFLLGEVLVAEALVQVGSARGYAAVLGRDLEQALAVALLDAATQLPEQAADILELVDQQRGVQEASDAKLLREVEATRVEMETF